MDPRVPLVLETQWVKARREEGALIWILDQTGRSWHADEGVVTAMGREVPSHGQIAIAPDHASEAAALLRRWFGRPMRAWLPIADDAGKIRWFRVEVAWMNVFIVQAMWPELDASKHRIHVESSAGATP